MSAETTPTETPRKPTDEELAPFYEWHHTRHEPGYKEGRKMANTIGVIFKRLHYLEAVNAAASPREEREPREGMTCEEANAEIARLEKVVAKFIVADVQRSSAAMMDGDAELQKTMFWLDTQRMKAIKERDEARDIAQSLATTLTSACQVDYQVDPKDAVVIASWSPKS